MIDEGYIKYNCQWIEEELSDKTHIPELNYWRDKLYHRQLIGAYKNGVGYGNISVRLPGNTFIITGTATGNINRLTDRHYTQVTTYDLAKNHLTCQGPIMASSESLTHAMIYKLFAEANAVVHIHNESIWKDLMGKVPTTSAQVAYGTPAMADEIVKLKKTQNLQKEKILVMAGHQDGIITFGRDLAEANNKITHLL